MPIQLPSPTSTAQGKVDAATSLTVSMTVKAGTERLLVLSVVGSQPGGANITGATWNGQAMTTAGSYTTPDGNNRKHYGFYLLLGDSGSDTTADIVVSGSASDYIGLAACQYNGVLQTGQPDVSVVTEQSSNGGGSTVTKTTSITTVTEHAWIVCLESGYNDGGAPTASTNLTRRVYETTYGTTGVFDTGGGVSAGANSVATQRATTLYRVSHILIAFKPGTLAPPIRLYVDGTEEYDGDQGDGAALRAAVAALANVGGTITLELGSASSFLITLSTKWTLPANSTSTPITIATKNLDSIHASGSTITTAAEASIVTLRSSTANTDPMIEAAKTGNGYIWRGVVFDYAARTGNTAIVTSPADTLVYDSAAQDAFLPAEQPDGWIFDRCIFDDKDFSTTSFRFVLHNGKAITFSDCRVRTMRSQGGQNDGYWSAGDVGEGPWTIERCDIQNVRGESQGYGTHGQRSGAGTDGVGDPGYQAFADADIQPLNYGYTMSSCRIVRDTSSRRSCWSTSTPLTLSVASKTLVVPPNMPFAVSEAVQITDGGAKTMSGTVTTYSGTSLTVDVTSVDAGSGDITGGAYVHRTGQQMTYKNMMEWTYGQDIVVAGVLFKNHWQDFNQQNHAINIKLSTQALTSLNHVAMRRVTFRYCVFQSLAALMSLAEYVATTSNPVMTDFVLEHCAIFDVDVNKYGAPGLTSLISLGTDMPANFRVSNCLIDFAYQPNGLLLYGSAGIAHPSITNFTGHEWYSNIILQQGNESYEMFGYYGTGPTNKVTPKGYLEDACTGVVFTHNSIVSSDPSTNWGSGTKDASNTWYTGGAGRTTLLGLLRNPSTATLSDRDYRYTAGQEQTGRNGLTRGPDWWTMYRTMGWTWPFSWTPDAPSGQRFLQEGSFKYQPDEFGPVKGLD